MATVTVTINGVEYNLKGHEDGEYLKKVAEYVEEKTQEMATKNNKLSALGVLSLSALNIADELFKGNDEYNQLIDYYEKVKSELEKSKKEIEDLKELEGESVSLKEKLDKITSEKEALEKSFNELKDKKDKNLIPKLYEETGVVINENVSGYLDAQIGDTIVLTYNNENHEYKVLGITEEFIGSNIYMSREELSRLLGLPKVAYNKKYSKDKKYADTSKLSEQEKKEIGNIMNFDDLERNIRKQMQLFNTSIYIVIFFASFMALVIIAVIANIVVEENKKTISLMKVMGYKNHEISSVVLNIYTPFVIVAYLLSIPTMIYLLKSIVAILTKDTNMVFPISMSPLMAIVGLISLVVAYYIAINLSRRVLNKVPLAVALKRE
ncbi:MAG: cell division protein ZapA [Firmicutes bacterium]|nr:cell division protein ZapA [Bacillota bacterium]